MATIDELCYSCYCYNVVHGYGLFLPKQVVDDSAKFDMLLKVKRGTKEEKYKAEVHKNSEGVFHLNQIEQDSA